jgi:MFS family permease
VRADLGILYASAFLRATATGLAAVLLGVHLAKLSLSPAQTGFVVGVGLGSAALATAVTMLAADRVGRRRLLVLLSALAALGAALLAVARSPWVVALAAFVGMVNGMGRDRGAALVIEQAALPGLAGDAGRTRAFAIYNVLQDAGHALGSLLAGLPVLVQRVAGAEELAAFRASLGVYAALQLLLVPLYLRLSGAIEAPGGPDAGAVSAASRRILRRIAALFALDSLGGGFLTTAMLSFFFFERFGVSTDRIGWLFFAARVANGASHLAAAWLARRIGLVNTMVFTHVPSSLLLVTVAFAPSFEAAALLFLLREGLVEMDVPTRQSYVMAVVAPHERAYASGLTHLVRMGAWALAPALAGLLMQNTSLLAPLLIGAGMKLSYDALLYRAFRRVRPPEEQHTL